MAFAGFTTRVSAVARTLPEVAAMGRATTNITEPTIVAKKQPGRARATSPTTISESCEARLVLTPPRLTRQIQMTVSNFSFIIGLSKEHCTGGDRLSVVPPMSMVGADVNGINVVNSVTYAGFAYMVWDRVGNLWVGTLFDAGGKPLNHCRLLDRSLACGS